jgi:hypothetical protein
MILIAHMARCSPPRHSVALIHLQALPLSVLAGSESAGSSSFRHKKPHLLQRGYAKQCSSLPLRGIPPLGRRKATEFCSLLLWPQHPVEKREVAEFSSLRLIEPHPLGSSYAESSFLLHKGTPPLGRSKAERFSPLLLRLPHPVEEIKAVGCYSLRHKKPRLLRRSYVEHSSFRPRKGAPPLARSKAKMRSF